MVPLSTARNAQKKVKAKEFRWNSNDTESDQERLRNFNCSMLHAHDTGVTGQGNTPALPGFWPLLYSIDIELSMYIYIYIYNEIIKQKINKSNVCIYYIL